MRAAIVIAASIALAGQAAGKTRFEAYEARDSVVEGKGGSRVTDNGIDYWTMGDPPRRYQIIGIIRDNRGTGVIHGNAIGSSGVAKLVKAAGGHAVVLLGQDTENRGAYAFGSGQGSGFSAFAVPLQERSTTFLVVRYLDAVPPAAPQP